MRKSSSLTLVAILLLFVVCAVIWYAALREDRRGVLTVSFLDVGQGDAIFIDAPSGRQVLVDGGSNAAVLRSLGRVLPWYDRSIDLLIATHPDADHIGGLIDVMSRYNVGAIIQSSVPGTTAIWSTFQRDVARTGATIVTGQRGQIIDLGGGAYIEVLFPDRDAPYVATNVGCVVTRLVYGATSFLLPCDTTAQVEKYLTWLDGAELHADVLKASHHGSKTSSLPLFVGFVDPKYAIYSRGCNNKYGHPHQETVETFARFEIPTLDTCEEGTITFVSDGLSLARK